MIREGGEPWLGQADHSRSHGNRLGGVEAISDTARRPDLVAHACLPGLKERVAGGDPPFGERPCRLRAGRAIAGAPAFYAAPVRSTVPADVDCENSRSVEPLQRR